MPYFDNRHQLEQRFNTCKEKFSQLFFMLNSNQRPTQVLGDIETYFRISFERATSADSAQIIITSYEQLQTTLSEVSAGTITANEAIKTLNETNSSRKMGIVFYNIAHFCEQLFWAIATVNCFMSAVSVGIPLMFLSPPIGLAITIGTSMLMLFTAEKLWKGFDDYKSFERLDHEIAREHDLISFFAPQATLPPHNEVYVSALDNRVATH